MTKKWALLIVCGAPVLLLLLLSLDHQATKAEEQQLTDKPSPHLKQTFEFQLEKVWVQAKDGTRLYIPDFPAFSMPLPKGTGTAAQVTTFTKTYVVNNIPVTLTFNVGAMMAAYSVSTDKPGSTTVVIDELLTPNGKANKKGFLTVTAVDEKGQPYDTYSLININGGVHIHVHF